MQVTDTIVLVGSINPKSEHNAVAKKYLDLVGTDQETFVPLANLIEFDLVMKGRKYTIDQRMDAFDWLSHFIPKEKIVSNSVTSLKMAAELQLGGLGYFDSLVSAIGIENEASVLTTDEMISRVTTTLW
jgi:predicted nucleic acid-binding protein